MLYLPYLLLALATCTACAALAPDISYAFNITDFQGHMLDLTDGNLQPFTPVQSYAPTTTNNQEWALISSQDARQLWEIINLGSNSILSHTTAFLKLKDPAHALHTQIVGSNQTLFWRMSFSTDGVARRELSKLAGMRLEYADPTNERQAFRLRCIRGWSMPARC